MMKNFIFKQQRSSPY